MSMIQARENLRSLPDGLYVEFPKEIEEEMPQDEEWCWLRFSKESIRIRFHDYHKIYSIPGLYEHLFYDRLKCCSPKVITRLLKEEFEHVEADFSRLRVLDLGAGNGMVGENLVKQGAGSVVGVDIIEEAAKATERDRPGLYEDYVVDDLTEPKKSTRDKLKNNHFNCLTSVAALGFGDIPPKAFCEAFNAVEISGWVAFNIKEDFVDSTDASGFSDLIKRIIEDGVLELKCKRRYRHRLALDGSPLYYIACVGTKQCDIPLQLIEEIRRDRS
jgi:SAM-dependent methyltransferase